MVRTNVIGTSFYFISRFHETLLLYKYNRAVTQRGRCAQKTFRV